MVGKLILLPNALLGPISLEEIPLNVQKAVSGIDGIIAESEKGARAFLKPFSFDRGRTFREVPISLLNEHSRKEDLSDLIRPLEEGQTWGLVSDAGLPCIADPGSALVRAAKQKDVVIEAHGGPCSIFLALMLSGFPGQRFAFHGYFPKKGEEVGRLLKGLVQRSEAEDAPQIFIEAPYRSFSRFEDLLRFLPDKTQLCLAWDLTGPTQNVITKHISDWKKEKLPGLKDKPTVFIIYS